MRRSRRNGQLRRTSSIAPRIALHHQDLFPVVRPSASTCPNGSATNEPPQNSRPSLRRTLVAHAIHRRHVHAVRNRVRRAGWSRQASCCAAPYCAFSDGCHPMAVGIEQNLRAAQRRQPRAFGIPLVPADQRRDAPVARVETAKAQIARREVVLFEVAAGRPECASCDTARAARRRHRSPPPCCDTPPPCAVRTSTRRSPRPAPPRASKSSPWWARESARPDRTRSSSSLSAEVLRAKQLLHADDLRALACGFADPPFGFGQILVGIERAGHLNQADAKFGLLHKTIVTAHAVIVRK